jgi:tripartite-type tricarboxylate transporter receptor subunit TctC
MPKGTSKEITAKINTAVQSALADSTVRTRVAELGQQIFPREQQTPDGLAEYQKAEIDKWWPVIKTSNIRGE